MHPGHTFVVLGLLMASLLAPATGSILVRAAEPTAASVQLDASDPQLLRLIAPAYTLIISRSNGAVVDLVDRASNTSLTAGSRGGCFWGVQFYGAPAGADYLGGCHYRADGTKLFSTSWDGSTATLTMHYWRDTTTGINAVATITAHDSFFDMRLTITNTLGWTISNVLFPSEWVFRAADVEAGYGAFSLPGIKLGSGFFAAIPRGAYTATYPSGRAFADYQALDIAGGHLAIMGVNPAPAPVQPITLGFVDDDLPAQQAFFIYHKFHTAIWPGEQWQSPLVRVFVGQPVTQTIQQYRQANGIDAYPSLDSRLGAQRGVLLRAPLIKADAAAIQRPFGQWQADLSRLPTPALLHLVAFQPGGFDEHYPELLPPDPRWGTTDKLRELVVFAQQRGMLVMPYTNPTWWDDALLTPQEIEAIAVRSETGQVITETYGTSTTIHTGVLVAPYAPVVRQRLAELMTQWRTTVAVDCVFEDQLGAREQLGQNRPWASDFHSAAPTPTAYFDGWLAHTARYTDQCLMTEHGWDRLAATELGFHGSLLLNTMATNSEQRPDAYWGAGNWQPFPLATWLFHEKLLLYQHDLAPETMSDRNEVLSFNLAFGMQLSLLWEPDRMEPEEVAWFDLVAALQQTVAARSAGQPLDAYTELLPQVTQSQFADLTIIANRRDDTAYDAGAHTIAPQGFLAQTADDALLAGVFTERMNGATLSAGEHTLIIERTPATVSIRQVLGADTPLTLDVPLLWQPGYPLIIEAVGADHQVLATATPTVAGRRLSFTYTQLVGETPVAAYRVRGADSVFIPFFAVGEARPGQGRSMIER